LDSLHFGLASLRFCGTMIAETGIRRKPGLYSTTKPATMPCAKSLTPPAPRLLSR
jgi:hypothetical protein